MTTHRIGTLLEPLLALSTATAMLCLSTATQAATITVGKGGTGQYQTIQEAVDAARESDTITIGPGVYEESVKVIDKSLTFRGVGPQYVTLKATTTDWALELKNRSLPPEKRLVRISGMTITSPEYWSLNVELLYELLINNCVFAGNMGGAIHHNTTSPQFAAYATMAPSISVNYCTFALNGSYVIYFESYSPGNNALSGSLTLRNSIFYNNNLLTANPSKYIVPGVSVSVNNVMYFGKSSEFTGEFLGDPKFLNAAQGNYVLGPGSFARDFGQAGPNNIDPDGTIGDLGAYGGPGAAAFWPYVPNGPVIREVTLPQVAVQQGGKITIKATATTR